MEYTNKQLSEMVLTLSWRLVYTESELERLSSRFHAHLGYFHRPNLDDYQSAVIPMLDRIHSEPPTIDSLLPITTD